MAKATALAPVAAQATSLAERMGAAPEMIALVRSQIAPGAPDDVLALYFARCQQLGVDPLGRMLYVIPRVKKTPPNRSKSGQWEEETLWQLQSSIDLFRTVAESHSDTYAGQDGPYWCGEDGQWTDVWLKKTPPAAAKVGVYRHGFTQPLNAVATWSEYAQTNKDGAPTGMWASMPALMLAKCAEALALRKAFPAKLTGLYTSDEMAQADNTRTAANVTPLPTPQPAPEAALPPAEVEYEPPAPTGQKLVTDETLGRITKGFATLGLETPQIVAKLKFATRGRMVDPDALKTLTEEEGLILSRDLVAAYKAKIAAQKAAPCEACGAKADEDHVYDKYGVPCPEDMTAEAIKNRALASERAVQDEIPLT